MTRGVLQQGLVLGLSHPVHVTPHGLVSVKAKVPCNLSLLIKVMMDTTCPESLTPTHCLSTSGSGTFSLQLFFSLYISFFICPTFQLTSKAALLPC